MSVSDSDAEDLLKQAIAIGENMIRIADAIGQPLAGNYFSIGLDILRHAAGEDQPLPNDMIIAPSGAPDQSRPDPTPDR